MSKPMAKEICHDNISYVATQGTEYRRGTLSRKKTVCHDRQWKEYDKSAKTKRVYFATIFSAGCQHKEGSLS